jgi:endonuclease/exonuclease/phosphatase (EEP) superfamily protein YafD
MIREADPDFVVLVEVDADIVAQARLLLPQYRFFEQQMIGPRTLGIALLSRNIPDEARLVHLGESGSPVLVARYTTERGALTIVGAHPLPPYKPAWFALRNAYLAKLAALVREQQGAIVVVGDLNMTPWTHHYDAFLDDAELYDSSSTFGLQSTWPSFLPAPLRIPIDHCFVSDDVAIVDRDLRSTLASDHLSIVVEFTID